MTQEVPQTVSRARGWTTVAFVTGIGAALAAIYIRDHVTALEWDEFTKDPSYKGFWDMFDKDAVTPQAAATQVPSEKPAPVDAPEKPSTAVELDGTKGHMVSASHPDRVYIQVDGKWYVYDRVMSGDQGTAQFDGTSGKRVLDCDMPKDIKPACVDAPAPAPSQPAPAPVEKPEPPAAEPVPKPVPVPPVVPPVEAPPVEPAPAPVPPPEQPPEPPVAPPKNEYAVYDADTDCDCTDQVAVVTRDVQADTVWTDKNEDGKHWKMERESGSIDRHSTHPELDRAEFKGVPADQVQRDYQELVKRGYKGDFIVYNLTDSNGRSFVACVKVDANGMPKSWDLFSADHTGDPREVIPEGHPARGKHVLLNGRALEDDLALTKKVA